MKKGYRNFFTILLTVLLGVGLPKLKDRTVIEPVVAAETTKTFYLKTSENWRTSAARFAAWVWTAPEENGTFLDLEILSAGSEIYKLDISNTYNRVIFVRMPGDILTNTWDTYWNQTSDLELPFDKEDNLYMLREGEWGQDSTGNNWGQEIGEWSVHLSNEIDPDAVDPDSGIEPSIYTFHYWRNDGKQKDYDLWLWGEGTNGRAYPYTGDDTFGRILEVASTEALFKNSARYINLIVRPGSWSAQTPDIKVDVTEYPLTEDGRRHFYLVDMETTVYKTAEEAKGEKLLSARFTTPENISVRTYKKPISYKLLADELPVSNGNVTAAAKPYTFFEFSFATGVTLDVVKEYVLEVTFETEVVKARGVTLEGIYDDPFFVTNLTYSGTDLGVTYTASSSTFKVWAPTTKELKLRLYDNGTPTSVNKEKGDDTFTEHDFVRGDKGVWSVSVSGDLHGKYYTLVATNSNGTNEFTDPYARAAGVNGIRGMIVDFSKTNPNGWENVNFSVKKETELIPYELHVSDLTADDTWNGSEWKRKNFLGLIESGTMYQKDGKAVKTGFDHIKELGINALQILPFYDQENNETDMEFNWGYNPKNYNVLEGGYSSDPYNGLVRINEFKQVVQAYAKEDIRIIMDVVYNHVASLSQHSFTKLVPGYYFRYNLDDSPRNSSGVGNDTAAERIMFERYMVDSTYFLANEYKLGGFRFDLMGLHTVDAMKAVMNKLKTYRDDIIVYGEPWNMESGDGMQSPKKPFAISQNLWQTNGVGGFNDQIRDAIKGSPNGDDRGWVQLANDKIDAERLNKIKDGMMGKVYGAHDNPRMTVNYVSVHDNYAIYDKMQRGARGFDGFTDPMRIKHQAVQAEALSLLGQGVGFVHAGSEILRSKPVPGSPGYFDHNSYESPYEVNSIKWDEKWENLKFHNMYRQMIALKRYSQAFNWSTRADVDANSTLNTPANNVFRLTYKAGQDTYTIYHFGVGTSYTITDINGQEVVLDTSQNNPMTPGTKAGASVRIFSNTTLITRNVRNRGSDDPTMPKDIVFTDFVPFTPTPNPYDTDNPVDPGTSMPPTTSLPGDTGTSEPGTPGATNTGKTFLIVGGAVGGVALVGGLVFLLIKVLRKKP